METIHRHFLESTDGNKPPKDKNPPIPPTMIFGYLKEKGNKKVLSTKNMALPGVHNITYADLNTST
jgi:hypothetical protein